MKNTKRLTAIMTTTILVSLMASSLVASATVDNWNPEMGTTSAAPAYMDASISARTYAAMYGDLLNEDYAWFDPHGNNPERNCFNPGPAPDRPDVLWRTDNIPIPSNVIKLGSATIGAAEGVNNPYVVSFSGAPMAMGGQLIAYAQIRPNATNSTNRGALVSLNPHTGTVNWASIVGLGPTAGASVGASFGVSSYIFKVDDGHFCTLGGGVSMWRTDGTFLWRDSSITPGAVYHSCVVAPAPVYMITGPRGVGTYSPYLGGWDLSEPETDRNTYNATGYFVRGNRNVWNYTIDEPGSSPQLCQGDGMVFMGSYSSTSVYAVNMTDGTKVWETHVQSAMGYMTTYAEGKLFCGCQSMHIYALNGTTGEIIWHNTDGTANRAFNVWNFAYAYGRVYTHDLGFGRTGATKCFDAETGELLWASQTLFWIGYYRILVGDGKVYGRQSDNSVTTGRESEPTNFACWDAFTGEELWEIRADIAGPILAYGCLYYIEGAGYGDTGAQLVALSTAFEPQDWSMFRGNVETPSFTLDKGPMDISGGPKWTFTTGSGIISSPAVVDGKVYITSNDRYVYCLDAYNGSLIWKFLTNEPLMTHFGSSPAVENGKVYIGPDDGNFYILDADTGEKLQEISMGTYRSIQVALGQHNIKPSPIIYQGRVYIGSPHNGRFYCLDLNGNEEWSLLLTGSDQPIEGSAAISGGYIYVMGYNGRIYKINMTGSVVLDFPTTRTGDSFWSGFWGVVSYTPTVVGDRLWIGGTNNRVRCYNVTTGEQIYAGVQPHVEGETSHGSLVYVPDWALPECRNSSGYLFSSIGGKLITQAGPTMACARADNGSNIWSAWGGWEIWSTPIFSGRGASAVVYYGSDSAGITVVNASNGVALSWYTAGGNLPGSPALWDGKLYVGSYDNKLYCFEDHPSQEMATSISVDKTQVDLNNTETVTVTMQLTKIPDINVYEEIGRSAPVPGLPNATVLATFTDPDNTEHTLTATTDNLGWASFTFTPNMAGMWKVMTWYEGEERATFSYGYAFSDQVTIEAAYTITEPTEPTEPTGTNIPMEYVYGAIAVIVIVLVAAAVLVLMRRRGKK